MLPGGDYKAPAPIYLGRALPHCPGRPQGTARPPQRRRCAVAVDQLIVTAAWLALRPWLCGQHLHVRVAHPDPQRQPPAPSGTASSFPITTAGAAVGLHDLDLETISRTNAIDRDGRHQPTLRLSSTIVRARPRFSSAPPLRTTTPRREAGESPETIATGAASNSGHAVATHPAPRRAARRGLRRSPRPGPRRRPLGAAPAAARGGPPRNTSHRSRGRRRRRAAQPVRRADRPAPGHHDRAAP
jgi:hypothetical protein